VTRTRSAALALALASTLLLSACGDGDDAASPTATPTPTVSQDRTKCPAPLVAVPATPGQPANTDLTVKPKILKGPGPRPKDVTYTDIVVGTGEPVIPGNQVELKYVGALYANGKEFDTSWGKPAGQDTFGLTACTVNGGAIVGFLIGPIGMKIGGRRQINIPAALGYAAEVKEGIPANSDLIFVVDLVRVDGQPPAPTTTAPVTTAPSATP
jgi:peptidylprolyl isomerase